MGSFDCCPGDDFECVRAFSDLAGLVDFEVTRGLRGFACGPGDGELSDAGRVEETEGFDKAVATETRVVADSAVNGDGGIVGGLAVNLNPGAERSAVGFRADEFDLEPVATMAGVLEERVRRLVAGRRPAKFNEEVEVAIAVVVQEGGAQTPERAAHAGLLGGVGKSPVVIAPENVTAIASDVSVRIAVTVIVSHGDFGQRKRKKLVPEGPLRRR